MDLLQYDFFQHALLGSLLTAIALWNRRDVYRVRGGLFSISGGITHASFGGLDGFLSWMNPILMAMLFSVSLSAFGVEWVSKTQNVREDSAIAGVWSLGCIGA